MPEIKVSNIGAMDMLKFKNLGNKRKLYVQSGSVKKIDNNYKTNEVAKQLHPNKQIVKVSEIIKENEDIYTIVLVPSEENGTLANFKAGQYINVTVNVDNGVYTRPYALASSPKDARNGKYIITVKRVEKGVVSTYLTTELQEGDILEISAPSGTFTYSKIRDEKRIVGIAGGVGVSPFYSLAQAILDGEEDVELTLFYAAKCDKDLIYRERLEDIVSKTNKVKVIYVLSEEENKLFEYGLITAKMIKKELYSPASIFMAGPSEMIEYLDQELKSLKIARKYFRYEDVSSKPKEKKYKIYKLTVVTKDEIYIIPCQSNETILMAMEKEGIKAPSKCHVGTCGFCRSKLIYGNIKMLTDNRRIGDKENNYIHPCCTYLIDDSKIELTI